MNKKTNNQSHKEIEKIIFNKMNNNNGSTKSIFTIFFHLIFWCITFYFYTHNTFTRPYIMNTPYKEFIIFAMIIGLVYLNYFIFFSLIYKKGNHKSFWFTMFISIIIISAIELFFIKDNVRIILHGLDDDSFRIYAISMFQNFIIRNTFFVSFFILFRFYKEARKSVLYERKIHEIQSLYFRTRITPHYLVGVINSLQSKSLTQPETLPPLLDKLNMIINYTLTDAIEEQVTLKEEIVFYNNYIELELLQCIEPIDYQIETQNINPELKITPLLFECPINNAFKFTRKDGKGYIKIKLYQPNPVELVFQCENNISPDCHLIRRTGLGLSNLRDRLDLSYPNHYELTHEEKNDTYFFTIRITALY